MGAVFNRDYPFNRGWKPLPPTINYSLNDIELNVSYEVSGFSTSVSWHPWPRPNLVWIWKIGQYWDILQRTVRIRHIAPGRAETWHLTPKFYKLRHGYPAGATFSGRSLGKSLVPGIISWSYSGCQKYAPLVKRLFYNHLYPHPYLEINFWKPV